MMKIRKNLRHIALTVALLSSATGIFLPQCVSAGIVCDTDTAQFYVTDDESGEKVLGPYAYIAEEAFVFQNDEIHRYIGQNGLYGYLVMDGDIKELTDPIFEIAYPFTNYAGCVSDGDGYYYINSNGDRMMSETYLQAYPYEEQGMCARVQDVEGCLWNLIDRDGQVLYPVYAYEKINPIGPAPLSGMGTGVKSGKAMVFDFSEAETTVTEYPEYSDISQIYDRKYAIVASAYGLSGVITVDGNLVVPLQYQTIHPWKINNGYEYESVLYAECPDGNWDTYRFNDQQYCFDLISSGKTYEDLNVVDNRDFEIVQNDHGQYGVVRTDGTELIPCLYDHIEYDWLDGVLKEDSASYFICHKSTGGNEIIQVLN